MIFIGICIINARTPSLRQCLFVLFFLSSTSQCTKLIELVQIRWYKIFDCDSIPNSDSFSLSTLTMWQTQFYSFKPHGSYSIWIGLEHWMKIFLKWKAAIRFRRTADAEVCRREKISKNIAIFFTRRKKNVVKRYEDNNIKFRCSSVLSHWPLTFNKDHFVLCVCVCVLLESI